MRSTKLTLALVVPTALAMFLALAGCDHDRGGDSDRMRAPDRRDTDNRVSDRHDSDRPTEHHDNERPVEAH